MGSVSTFPSSWATSTEHSHNTLVCWHQIVWMKGRLPECCHKVTLRKQCEGQWEGTNVHRSAPPPLRDKKYITAFRVSDSGVRFWFPLVNYLARNTKWPANVPKALKDFQRLNSFLSSVPGKCGLQAFCWPTAREHQLRKT